MSDKSREDTSFDEDAALEDIERTRKEIERYRAERRAKEEEFVRFIAASRQGVSAPPPPSPPPPPVRAVREPDVAFDDERVGRGHKVAPMVSPDPIPPTAAAAPPEVSPPTVPTPLVAPSARAARSQRKSSNATMALIGGLAIVLAGAGYVAWNQQPSGAPEAPAATSSPPPAATAEQDAPAAITPPTPQPSPDEAVLTTTRRVWVRVIADGVPVIERELAAGTRVPFIARKTIVIRTGDAGAVQLAIGGVDKGALGRVGEVVTRRFDVAR